MARASQKGRRAAAGEGPARAPMPPDRAKAKVIKKNSRKAERDRYDSSMMAANVSTAAPRKTLKASGRESASRMAAMF